MKRIYLSVILSLFSLAASSRGYFTDLPQKYQLYSHNADNRAGVVFSGVTTPDYTKLPVQTLREGVLSVTLARRQLKRLRVRSSSPLRLR